MPQPKDKDWLNGYNPYICCLQKTHLKIQKITRGTLVIKIKEGHYIMIKGSIQEEDITIVNIYAPNKGAPQYIRQTLT